MYFVQTCAVTKICVRLYMHTHTYNLDTYRQYIDYVILSKALDKVQCFLQIQKMKLKTSLRKEEYKEF